jgi:urea transport system ATP-binding protein
MNTVEFPKSTPNQTTQPMLQVSGINVFYGESHILRNVDMNVFRVKWFV